MTDNNNTADKPGTAETGDIISGDLFQGIAVSEYTDIVYSFCMDGHNGQIFQSTTRLAPDRMCVSFLFLLDSPMRFRVDVLVPEDCSNARVSLQDKELIGFFSSIIPDDPDPVICANCEHSDKISTLHPGRFQSVNFRWESGDVLKFYFYY